MIGLDLLNKLRDARIIAVLIVDASNDALHLAEALLKGGINAMELTLRTEAALPSLKLIRERFPEMLAGVGTVLTTRQVDQVLEAGAQFAVAPGFNRKVVSHSILRGLPFGPGVMTPSDIEGALELECTVLKFFPAESSGGLAHLQSMAAPYQHKGIQCIPLGGLTQENFKGYLSSPFVPAVGGSWIASRKQIADKNWTEIRERARRTIEIANIN